MSINAIFIFMNDSSIGTPGSCCSGICLQYDPPERIEKGAAFFSFIISPEGGKKYSCFGT
jgi:hypothetical protein